MLVTGATGRQGGAVAHELLEAGFPVRALTRRPEGEPARALAALGAEVVEGDLDDRDSLARAVEGAWGVFSVQNFWETGAAREEEQGERLARVAREGGVRHFVYSSVNSADQRTGISHFESKAHVEEAVRALGFPTHVVLRPAFFMENWLSPQYLPLLRQGRLAIALDPSTVLQMSAVRDIGKYGRWAFENPERLSGRAIDLASDEHTMPETARILGKAMGRKVEYVQVPIVVVRERNEDVAQMLEWFDRVGYDADIPRLAQESGIRPTSLADWAETVDWSGQPAHV